jgi:hypothetical protein
MAFSFTETDDRLLYQEQRTPLLRIFVSVFGLFMIAFLYVFVELIFQMGAIDTTTKIGGVIASAVGLTTFILFGGYCLRLTLFTPEQILLFYSKRKQLDYITNSRVKKSTKKTYLFNEIAKIGAIEYFQDDGSATFSVAIILSIEIKFASPLSIRTINCISA